MTTADAGASFVPGHVTVFFAPHRQGDPGRTGSTGAGIALSEGVDVRVDPDAETTVTLNGEPAGMAAVEHVLEALSVSGRVTAETPLPVGTGFGVSGATALGTALAATALLDAPRSENALVDAAHRAEVRAGTGLGDVIAQARGGVPIRLAPGGASHGRLDGVPAAARLEYRSFGELSTRAVIGGDTDAIERAGRRALEDLRARPTLGRLFELGRRFAREADLLTERVETAIEAVAAAGGTATMAMLGETVIALDTGLSDAGYDPQVCRVDPAGARLRPPSDGA